MRTESNQHGIADSSRADYVERVNRVIDHVLAHLDRPLNLEAAARVAHFSPFHFHRVFRAITGETLAQFVKRLRLERALYRVSHAPHQSLTEIALDCGFASSSDFSRSFKQRYGVPPSAFDIETFRASGRADWLEALDDPGHRYRLDPLPPGENPDGFEVTLRSMAPREVAYVRVPDPFRPDVVPNACERLVAWAEERGLADGTWLGYMWEDPDLVPREQCRYDVGLELPPDGSVPAEGEVGRLRFPKMLVAEVELRGDIQLEQRALDWIYGTWLPGSGYVPTDQPAFEVWMGRPFEHGFEHFELFLHLPIAARPEIP